MNMGNYPFISVVIPAFNAQENIGRLLDSLFRQTYPPDFYEVIVVDNNSNDLTGQIVNKYPAKFLKEPIQSSYAARNTGITHSKGSIIAFIDSDCIAENRWLEEGVKAILSEGADLAGGRVDFAFCGQMSVSQMYDAITHLNMRWSVLSQGTSGTANLFVKREVFEKVGIFRGDVKSGGDIQFTHKAVAGGHKLVYAEAARVRHPARTFKELLKKSFRIGYGSIEVMAAKGKKNSTISYEILRDLLPPNPLYIKRLIRERGTAEMEQNLFKIFAIAYLCRIVRGSAMVSRIAVSSYSRIYK